MVSRLPSTPMTSRRRPVVAEADEPGSVRRPSVWKMVVATALTAFGLVCVSSPGLLGRHHGFPSESLVGTSGVCVTAAAAMAASATLVGWRRRRGHPADDGTD
jgi:hypothetical protein